MGKASKKKVEEEEETYEVESIIDARGTGKKREYKVKWVGYSAKQSTWEPISNLSGVKDMIDEYENDDEEEPPPPPKKAAPKKAAAAPAKKPTPAKKAPTKVQRTRAKEKKPTRTSAGSKRAREEEEEEEPPAKAAKAAKAPPKVAAKEEKKKKDDKIDIASISKLLMSSMGGKVSEKGSKAKAPPKEKESKPPKGPKEKAAKPKKGKDVGEDVAEVDKIVGMRVDSNGGLEFHIQWKQKGKTNKTTWEPEDNIMDDDLVDEFEEAQQVKVYGSDTIKAGAQVEVKNVMEGFQNSWTVATVSSKKGDKFTVSYDAFVDDDGNADVEKGVDRSRLRLVPSKVTGWSPVLGEVIEVNEDDCWWEAHVQEKKGKALKVMFRVSDEVKTVQQGAKTRPCSWLKLLNKK